MAIQLQNTITKEEFLSGQTFLHYYDAPGGGVLYFEPKKESWECDWLRKREGDKAFCIVGKVDKSGFTFSYHLFNKQFKGKVLFCHCIKYNPK